MKLQGAFTLIELILVLIIIGVLVRLALPNVFSSLKKTQSEQLIVNLKSLKEKMFVCLQSKDGRPEIVTCADNFPKTDGNYEYHPQIHIDANHHWTAASISTSSDTPELVFRIDIDSKGNITCTSKMGLC